jgi:cell wall-associated NlpC family hydrolase
VTTNPQPGDFAVTSITGSVGFLISVGEYLNGSRFGHWDHAFVYVGDDQLVEAEPGGARIASLDEYASRPVAWSTGHIELTDAQRTKVVAAARGYAGVGSSAADYFAIAAPRFHLPVPGLKDFVADSKHLICSQLVDKCYQDAGVQLFRDQRWNGYVTPADLGVLVGA